MSKSECWANLTPRDPERIDEILSVLGEVWKLQPDLRFGQLLFALTPSERDPFYIEDNILKDNLLMILNQISQGKSLDEAFAAIHK